MIVVAICALCTGCSMGLRTVPSGWDGTTEPECDDGWGPVIGDALVSGTAAGIGLAATDDRSDQGTAFAIAGLAVGTVFAIFAGIGEERVRDCKTARTAWRVGGAIGHGAADETMRVQGAAAQRLAESRPPGGWYCAVSAANPGAGFCVREHDVCWRDHDEAIAATADLEPCETVETAWCFLLADGRMRCAPGEEACREKRAQTHTTATVRSECEERR